ncbi:MAG: hypothetical protein M1822_000339 [Bathelium mastoideum]|nr:MAG: hypothetical protein M1822_000339 [Bathelium mastoideum]
MQNQADLALRQPSPTQDHVDSFEEFFEHLNQAAKSALPRKPRRYDNVYVLLLRWEDDDLGTQTELDALKVVFEKVYGYSTEEYLIPSHKPAQQLEWKLINFRQAYDAEQNLLILYYGGHGSYETHTKRSIWAPNPMANVMLVWSDLQGVLVRGDSDVVFILDCCFAATASRGTLPGTKEGLWACSSTEVTTGVHDNSFTRNLIEELTPTDTNRLSVVMLHARLLRRYPDKLKKEPWYTYLGDVASPSVEFTPIHNFKKGSKAPTYGIDRSVTEKLVLLAVRLNDAEKIPSRQHWREWVTDLAPKDVASIQALGRLRHRDLVRLEGYFLSGSALILVSLPIFLWERLPDIPAYSFVDFIKAGNVLIPPSISQKVRSHLKKMTGRNAVKKALEGS